MTITGAVGGQVVGHKYKRKKFRLDETMEQISENVKFSIKQGTS